jgi:hypothetical protein
MIARSAPRFGTPSPIRTTTRRDCSNVSSHIATRFTPLLTIKGGSDPFHGRPRATAAHGLRGHIATTTTTPDLAGRVLGPRRGRLLSRQAAHASLDRSGYASAHTSFGPTDHCSGPLPPWLRRVHPKKYLRVVQPPESRARVREGSGSPKVAPPPCRWWWRAPPPPPPPPPPVPESDEARHAAGVGVWLA